MGMPKKGDTDVNERNKRRTPKQATDYSLSSVQHAITVEVKLVGNPIQMIVDTGAGVPLSVNEHFVMIGSINYHF